MKDKKIKKRIKKRLIPKKIRKLINKKVRKMLFYSLLVAVLVLVLALSSIFNIKKVSISGVTHYKDKEILQKAGIQFGQNWYKYLGFHIMDIITFSNTNASMNIATAFPYVKDVTVRFVPFGNVRIRVVERIPILAVSIDGGKFVIIDNVGFCLDKVDSFTNMRIPLLENSKVRTAKPGDFIDFAEPYVLENINKLYSLVQISDSNSKTKLSNQITSFDLSSVTNTIIVLDFRIRVNMGDTSKLNNYKLNFLKEVFFNKIRKEDKGFLDFSKEDKPIFVPE